MLSILEMGARVIITAECTAVASEEPAVGVIENEDNLGASSVAAVTEPPAVGVRVNPFSMNNPAKSVSAPAAAGVCSMYVVNAFAIADAAAGAKLILIPFSCALATALAAAGQRIFISALATALAAKPE